MRKHSYSPMIVVSVSVVFLLFATNPLAAQGVTFSLPDSVGSLGINPNTGGLMGFAWGDYDGDGDLDLLLGGTPSVLFRNDVASGGGFVRVSAETEGEAGKILFDAGTVDSYGAVWADFDGNGKLDLLVGDAPDLRIFLNDGKVFTIVDPVATGLTVGATRVWGITAGDFDRDGDVDIAMAGGTASADGGGPPHVLQNNNGVFTDVAGELIGTSLTLESWSPQWVDVNNDGFLDLWLPTLQRNISPLPRCELLINGSGGELVASDPTANGLKDAVSAIVSTWGDYNNDGFMDLWLHPYTGEDGANKLYRNNGNGTFTDVAPELGMNSLYENSGVATRGAAFGDYDNDGWLDLLVQRKNGNHELWRNNGDGTFTEVGEQARLRTPSSDHRSVAFVDYDTDGWLDVFLSAGGSAQEWLFHNDGGSSGHWIGLRPKGTTGTNTAGIGARVTVVTGSHRQIRYVEAGGADGINGFLYPHFGLGSATKADSVIVQWPAGGRRDVSTNIPADKYYKFEEGKGITGVVKNHASLPTEYELKPNYPNPFNPTTKIVYAVPITTKVRLQVFDVLGRKVTTLVDETKQAGEYSVDFDASSLVSGVYMYQMTTPKTSITKKMVLIK